MSSHERPLFRSAVFLAAENDRGEVLLQLRTNTGFLDGHWDLTGTGHLEYGESVEACAVREVREEAGIIVDAADMELMALFQSDFEVGMHYISAIYRAKKWRGDGAIGEPDKIAELAWFAPDNFPAKLTVGAHVFLMSLGSARVRNYYIGKDEYHEMMGHDYE